MEQSILTGTATFTSYRAPLSGEGQHIERTVEQRVPVPHATALQAPVAAHIPESLHFRASSPGGAAEIRTLNGMLYRLAVNPRTDFGQHLNSLQARSAIRAGLERFIQIGDELWEQIAEPVLEVGLNETVVTPGASDRGAWQVFALTEPEAAIAAGKAMDAGLHRGNRPVPQVEVFIPSVFTMTTSAERVTRAREAAEAEVARAERILRTLTPAAMSDASRILMEAAKALAWHTGENAFNDRD